MTTAILAFLLVFPGYAEKKAKEVTEGNVVSRREEWIFRPWWWLLLVFLGNLLLDVLPRKNNDE